MLTVFALACHPDDIEFVMSGTLLLLQQQGWNLHYMNIANGSLGTEEFSREDIIRIRTEEARKAANSIGAVFHAPLVDDYNVFFERETLAKVASVVRQVAPDILLLQSPVDYMEDHQNAARLGIAAAFCRGMPNMPVDPPFPSTNKDVVLYHAQPHGNRDMLRRTVHAGMYVNISGVLEQKRAMLACHESQKNWLDASQGMDSYLISMEETARETGKLSGRYEYAEGWRRHHHIGYSRTESDPLYETLKENAFINEEYEKNCR
ncbi:MAG: PIG-L family deacetylase [Planctomycetaceae bacterium]|jgi:LmbE family N-acetylglucosaminyl deacetylase|nr:PIG-L family deacetylase [Planctomycetaceae bacterium]